MSEQLLLFKKCSDPYLESQIIALREQCERLRKGQFAKIGELTKLYNETKYELEQLKAAMCRSTPDLSQVVA